MQKQKNTYSDEYIDFTSEQFLNDPYPYLKYLRDKYRIYYDSLANRWFILHYDDAQNLLPDGRFCHDLYKAAPESASHKFISQLGDEYLAPLFQDPPLHTQIRSTMAKQFSPRNIEAKEKEIQRIIAQLLQTLNEKEADLVREYISPFTIRVIAKIIGVLPDDWSHYIELARLNNYGFDTRLDPQQKQQVVDAQQELQSVFISTIKQRRIKPQDDFISDMAMSNAKFSDQQIAITCQFLIRAGNLTSTDMIANGVYHLLSHDQELKKLVSNWSLLDNAIEEVMRYDPPAFDAGRITTTPIQVGEETIPAGQTVMISLASANHDPKMFKSPEDFSITRENTAHLSFGGGPHFCMGASLARLEAKIAIKSLIQQFPNIRLHPEKVAKRHGLPSFRGFSTLPVKLK